MEQIKTAIHKSWKRREIPSQSWWQTPINHMEGLGVELNSPQGHLIPDGICLLPEKQRVIILEVARTSEYTGSTAGPVACLEERFREKEEKYAALREELTGAMTGMEIRQTTFIAGVKGTLMEEQWKRNLEILAIPEDETESIIVGILKKILEVQHKLWIARKRGAGEAASE
eukprot:209485-Rhodomonas_salina.1